MISVVIMPETAPPLAAFLAELRRNAGLTQTRLGALMGGYSQGSVGNIETGRQQSVSSEMLALWLDACGANNRQRVKALALAGRPSPAGDSAGPL